MFFIFMCNVSALYLFKFIYICCKEMSVLNAYFALMKIKQKHRIFCFK